MAYFLFNDKLNFEKAVVDVNKALKSSRLILKVTDDEPAVVALLNGEYISTEIKEIDAISHITFSPSIFKMPQKKINEKLISVMMPFSPSYRGTYEAIKKVAHYMNLDCLRADDMWNNSTIMQDVYS